MTEVWKPVVGFERLYLVSSLGRVMNTRGKVLVASCVQGYPRVTLCRSATRQRREYVHRLVLEAFVGPCPDGMECCHEDGVRTNCEMINLRWDTKVANQADRIKHGTNLSGFEHPRAKLTAKDIAFIRRAYVPRSRTRGARPIAHRLGLHPVYVEKIARREERIDA